jgi:phosphatidate cytidylyltransferase
MELTNFWKRFITSAVIVALLASLFLLRYFTTLVGVYFFDAFLLFIMCIGVFEIAEARRLNRRGAKEYVAIIVLSLFYFFFILGKEIITETPFPWWAFVIVFTLIVGIFFLFIWLSNMTDKNLEKRCKLEKLDTNREAFMGGVDFLQMLLYPGLMIFSMIIINHLTANYIGFLGLLLIFTISCMTDTFAYTVGLTLGKNTPKMCPKISPHKTWVGFIGGIFGGVLFSLLVFVIMVENEDINLYLTDKLNGPVIAFWIFFAIGLIGSLVTAAGDLIASLIKRQANIKDFAKYLPGHGGVMDRIDGITFNAIFIFIIMGIITLL